MTLPPIEDRLADILRRSAVFIRPRKACGVLLFFVKHPQAERLAPYTIDGLNHFINCPEASKLKRATPAAATVKQ